MKITDQFYEIPYKYFLRIATEYFMMFVIVCSSKCFQFCIYDASEQKI